MAKAKINRKELEKIIELNDSGIAKLASFGTPLESLTDEEVELEISANRPDLLVTPGLIRAMSNFLKKTKPKQYPVKKSQYKVIVESKVKTVRPYTRCAVIKNLDLDDRKIKEIVSIQEKLHVSIGKNRKKLAIGIYPLDKVKFPVTYTAKSPKEISFQPLGAEKIMTSTQILDKTPAGKEYSALLKDFDRYSIFIDSSKSIISMPPIINSEHTGRVTNNTKDLFIECSGANPLLLDRAIAIISTALADLGGEIFEVSIQDSKSIRSPDLAWKEHELSIDNIEKTLGVKIKESELEPLLNQMGHIYNKKSILVAPWRSDILHEIDLIEDIAIAYGYDNLTPELPKIATIAEENQTKDNKIIDILVGLGCIQIMNNHLVKKEELSAKEQKIEVENSKSEYSVLRPNLLIPIYRTLSHNTDAEYPQRLFEIGTTFKKDDSDEVGIKETKELIIAITPGNYTESKQVLEYLMRMLNQSFSLEEGHHEGFIEGRVARIKSGSDHVGFMGEVHPNTLKEWRLKMPLGIISLNLDLI